MKWLFLLLLLCGCGKPNIDPAFQGYVNEWNDTYPNNKVNVDVQFRNLIADNIAGSWNGVQVLIDPTNWYSMQEPGQQQVIFHEFGHAIFNYGHDFYCFVPTNSELTPVQCVIENNPGVFVYVPRSIMFPYVFGDMTPYTEYNGYYIEQLGNCTTCTDPRNGSSNDQIRKEVLPGIRID